MNLYYSRKHLGHLAKRLLGLKYIPARYAPMYREIAERRPRTIIEVGTNDGLNAVRMLRLTDAAYYGFDLFEDLDSQTFRREFALRVPSRSEVEQYLKAHRAKFKLYAGDTRVTLASADLPQVDFIFIDGGHSEETVQSDWDNCRRLMHENTVVYFDDYPLWGIGPVVDRIGSAEIMPEFDDFPGVGRLHLARVASGSLASTIS